MSKKNYLFLPVLFLVLVNLAFVLFTGWSSDDLIYQSDKIKANLENNNFFSYYMNTQTSVAKYIGRIAPAMTCMIFPYFFENLLAYKILLVVLSVICIYLLYFLVKLLTNNSNIAILSVLIVQLTFQFRLYHESLVSFYGVAQVMTILIFLNFIFLYKYLISNKLFQLIISLSSYSILILIYETGILFFLPIFLLTILQKTNFKKKIAILLPFIIISLMFLSIYTYNRQTNLKTINYSGATISKDIPKFINLYRNQVTAAFPLSYSFSRDGKLLDLNKPNPNKYMNLFSLLISITYFFLIYQTLNQNMSLINHEESNYHLLIYSLSFLLLPSFLTSISVKYQSDMSRVGFGFGYIFVYISFFGFSLFVLFFKNYIQRKKYLFSLFFTIIFFLNFSNNLIVLEQAKTELYNHEYMLIFYLKNQKENNYWSNNDNVIFVDQNDPTVINTEFSIWVNAYPWKNKYLIYKYLNKIVNVLDLNTATKQLNSSSISNLKIIIINSSKIPDQNYIIGGTVDKLTSDGNKYYVDYHTQNNSHKSISFTL